MFGQVERRTFSASTRTVGLLSASGDREPVLAALPSGLDGSGSSADPVRPVLADRGRDGFLVLLGVVAVREVDQPRRSIGIVAAAAALDKLPRGAV